jgi:hypothetical protein
VVPGPNEGIKQKEVCSDGSLSNDNVGGGEMAWRHPVEKGCNPLTPYVMVFDRVRGPGASLSSHSPTRSSIDTEAAHVSAMFRTPGVVSYLSIHCSISKGAILTILNPNNYKYELVEGSFVL